MPLPITSRCDTRTSPPLRRLVYTLCLTVLASPGVATAGDTAAPAKSDGNSIGDGFRSLGQQISDPKTLDRIKGHEQELEKNVEGKRDQQRKNHPGELRASDATDMANDPKMGGKGARGGAPKTAPPPKAGSATTKTVKPRATATPDAKSAGGAKTPPPAATAPAR